MTTRISLRKRGSMAPNFTKGKRMNASAFGPNQAGAFPRAPL
jgi:hypothetical protein